MVNDSSRGRRRAAPVRIDFETVLAAGLESFARKGFHGTSMRDIAGAAGTSLSNLYNYVPSKVDLLAEVLEVTAGDLLERLREAVVAAPAPRERLVGLVSGYIDFTVDFPDASRIGVSEIRYLDGPRRAGVVEVRDSVESLFAEAVAAGVESGEFHTEFPRDAARAVVGLCTSLANWYLPDGRLNRDDVVTRYTSFALGVVGAD